MSTDKKNEIAEPAIGRRDVLRHIPASMQSFGVRGTWGVVSGAEVIEVARRRAACREPRDSVLRLFEQYAGLERQAGSIYRRFSELRRDRPEAFQFLGALVQQERRHAEVVTLAGIEAACGDVTDEVFQQPRERFETLQRQMREWEESITEDISDEEMVAMIVAIEASELDAIYDALIGASGAAFPLALAHGVDAQWYHLDFIKNGLDTLRSPDAGRPA